jgi:hypothetical protein
MLPEQKADLESMRASVMQRQGDVEEQEDELYSAAAPKGKFTGKAANALVDATNKLLPLFGVTDLYDKFTEPALTTLPPAFARLLTMFSKAFDTAIEDGTLPEEAKIDLSVVTDDTGLQGLAGRIGMAAKSAPFKRFLMKKVKEPTTPTEGEGESMEEEATDESPESTDTLFAGRM